MNDYANLHQILIADPIRIIAKSNSSTSINAKAIKVIKPDLVPPSNERNKNSEKENGNELHVVEYEDGNIFRDKFFEKENKEGNNSLEKDNRSKMNMEEKSITEEDAKRRKLDHEFYSIQDNRQKFDKEDDRDMSSIYDSGILDMIKTTTESREKNPLPYFYTNCSQFRRNSVLRFDDIGTTENGFSVTHLIPRGLRQFVVQKEDHSQGSKHYGFVDFCSHEIALSFINKFNKLKIPGTDLTYNLSWAPFNCECTIFKKPIDGSEGIQFDVPQVGVLKALEMKTQYKVDEIATGLEKLFLELDEQAHSGTDASAFWTPYEEEKFATFGCDGGFATTLILHHMDHVMEKDQIRRVFEKYGDCRVDLPPGGGSATVTFSERSCAVSASKDISTALVDRPICGLSWGIKIGEHPRDESAQGETLPCYICGSLCPKGQKSVNRGWKSKPPVCSIAV